MEHLGRSMDIFNTQSVYRLFGKASIVTSGRNQSDKNNKTIKQKTVIINRYMWYIEYYNYIIYNYNIL